MPPDWQNYSPLAIDLKKERGEGYLLCDGVIGGGHDGRQFLDQMGTVAGLLQLLDDGDDDVIVDALGVDLHGLPGGRRRRRWGVMISARSTATPGTRAITACLAVTGGRSRRGSGGGL